MSLRFSKLIALVFFISGCNYSILKGNQDSFEKLSTDEKMTMMNYAFISSRIIGPKCATCHGSSGNVNLETYENVVSNLEGIRTTVFKTRTMPKQGSLTYDENRLLYNWIELGAPRESESEPPVNTDLLIATFESIDKHVFQPKCNICHNPTGTAPRVLLDKQSLLTSPRELVLPGNPDESGLVIALERSDENRMPPASEGYSSLKDDEKLIIREWIQAGASN